MTWMHFLGSLDWRVWGGSGLADPAACQVFVLDWRFFTKKSVKSFHLVWSMTHRNRLMARWCWMKVITDPKPQS